MSLRVQLLAFGLLTGVLPWAGWLYVQEMETALRSGFEQSLVASAGTVAAALGDSAAELAARRRSQGVPGAGAPLYAHPLSAAPDVDGFRNDWNDPGAPGGALDGGHRFWVGIHEDDLYVFLAVRDEDVIYQGPPGAQPYGDRVLLSVGAATGGARWLLLATQAPGVFRAQWTEPAQFAPSGRYQETAVAGWQERADGYSVEIRVPLSLAASRLGIGVIDVDAQGSGYAVTTSTSWPAADGLPARLVRQDRDLDAQVERFARGGERYRVLDAAGWVMADAGGVAPLGGASGASSTGLAEDFFRFALGRGDPAYTSLEAPPGRVADPRLAPALDGEPVAAWYGSGAERDAIVAAAVPIRSAGQVVGAVLLEQASEPILTVTNQALLRLMTLTLLASLAAALGLLGFATVLSFRVRRLARAAETALGPKGEIDARLPGRAARDELGDLARSFADLLARLRDYTGYLRSLTSKLSHELRTPVAIVTTSLDNLEHEVATPEAQVYMRRLREGSRRLDSILGAMSEATRIEQAIGEAEIVDFELGAVIGACCEAYMDVYPEHEIAYSGHARGLVRGSPELVAQMMDKLVENAASFSPPRSRIDVELDGTSSELVLRVVNSGSRLPENMRRQLFDSLVSVRPEAGGRAHLGLGLYIVALIVDLHRGRVDADNLPSGDGVAFTARFPRRAD